MKSSLPPTIAAISYFLTVSPIFAQRPADDVDPNFFTGGRSTQTTVDIGSKVSGFFNFECITELVFRIVDAAIIGAGILLLIYLVWGGLEWLTSGGDKAKLESARAKITSALIGVAIIAAAYAFWIIILTFFGINAPDICSKNPLG